VLTSLIAARTVSSSRRSARLRPSGSGSLADSADLASAPVPFARRPSCSSGLRCSERASSRGARGRGRPDRSSGSRHGPWRRPSRGSPLGARAPAAGRDNAVALGGLLAAKRWIAVTSSVVCSIVKGPSPHSVPIRLDPEGSRFRLSPHSVPLEFLPVPGRGGTAHGTRIRATETCVAAGTRWELGGNHRGPRRGRRGGPGRATLRPPWRAPLGSPAPHRVHHPYKGARRLQTVTPFKGENPESLRGVLVRRAVAKVRPQRRRNRRPSTPRTLPGT
jgi:hypothetical protein